MKQGLHLFFKVSRELDASDVEAIVKPGIHQLAPGEEVVITQNQQPVAKLVSEVPKPKSGLRQPPKGCRRGTIRPRFDESTI
jgi:hypothetical protein